MTSTTFRTKTESVSEQVPQKQTPSPVSVPTENVDIPYTNYETEKGHPYSVDHFELGSFWNEGDAFAEDVQDIESFIEERIKSGDWANTQGSVKENLRKLERMANVSKSTNTVLRIGTIRSYVNFLRDSDRLRKDFGKYARYTK